MLQAEAVRKSKVGEKIGQIRCALEDLQEEIRILSETTAPARNHGQSMKKTDTPAAPREAGSNLFTVLDAIYDDIRGKRDALKELTSEMEL